MARNGTGTQVLPAGQPVVGGTAILASTFNLFASDTANEITNSVARDGQSPMMANLPMGGFKATNLSPGTAPTDSVRFDQIADPVGMPCASGLRGFPQSATSYTFQADNVTMRNSVGAVVTRPLPSLTVDLTLGGPAANGRDVAAAFSTNVFIYFYAIWNGANVSLLASQGYPYPNAMPSNYTHSSFLTCLRFNSSSQIVPATVRGSYVAYDLPYGGVTRLLNGGTANSMTSIGDGSYIPAISIMVDFLATINVASSAGNSFYLLVKAFGEAAGKVAASITTVVASAGHQETSQFRLPNNASTIIQYQLTAAPASASIDILGYTIPNGDV